MGAYGRYREQVARSPMVGLEILVAAGIRTVALAPTRSRLGILMLIRRPLSWRLVVDTEARSPWVVARRAVPPE